MSERKSKVKMPILSYTAINTYKTCPRQFEARYITKETKFTQNPAAARGSALHKFMELWVTSTTEEAYKFFKEHKLLGGAMTHEEAAAMIGFCSKRVNFVRKMADKGMKVYTELQLATDGYGSNLDWWDHNNWLRGAIDVLLVDEENGSNTVIDWKTGKTMGDRLQIECNAILCRAFNGHSTCNAAFVNLDKKEAAPYQLKADLSAPRRYAVVHENLNTDLKDTLQTIYSIEKACEANTFVAKPSGLCRGWCDVASCPHNKGKK